MNVPQTFFAKDNKKSSAKDSLVKVATLRSTMNGGEVAAEPGQTPQQIEFNNIQRAAEIFEQIGRESLESKLGSYSAKGYFFQALLCLLALGDNVAGENKLNEFKNADYTFPTSRECQLIDKLVEALNNSDEEGFSTACQEYDRISPLDPWKTTMLLKVKNQLSGGGSGGAEEGDLT